MSSPVRAVDQSGGEQEQCSGVFVGGGMCGFLVRLERNSQRKLPTEMDGILNVGTLLYVQRSCLYKAGFHRLNLLYPASGIYEVSVPCPKSLRTMVRAGS